MTNETEVEKLIRELRAINTVYGQYNSHPLYGRAADLIEAQAKEITAYREALESIAEYKLPTVSEAIDIYNKKMCSAAHNLTAKAQQTLDKFKR